MPAQLLLKRTAPSLPTPNPNLRPWLRRSEFLAPGPRTAPCVGTTACSRALGLAAGSSPTPGNGAVISSVWNLDSGPRSTDLGIDKARAGRPGETGVFGRGRRNPATDSRHGARPGRFAASLASLRFWAPPRPYLRGGAEIDFACLLDSEDLARLIWEAPVLITPRPSLAIAVGILHVPFSVFELVETPGLELGDRGPTHELLEEQLSLA